jgi:hypothetical protein
MATLSPILDVDIIANIKTTSKITYKRVCNLSLYVTEILFENLGEF